MKRKETIKTDSANKLLCGVTLREILKNTDPRGRRTFHLDPGRSLDSGSLSIIKIIYFT